jgi:hypothetical protein
VDFENSWIFPLLEAIHVIGLALLVGTIVLGDLATLGFLPRFSDIRWTLSGAIVMLLTGAVMFVADTDRYLANPAFLVKMGVLAGAALLYRARSRRWGAIASLTLWTFGVFAARAIIDFDV